MAFKSIMIIMAASLSISSEARSVSNNDDPLQNNELHSISVSNLHLNNELDTISDNHLLQNTESNDLDSIPNYPLQNTGLDSISNHPLWYTELLHTDEPRSFRIDPYWLYQEDEKANTRHVRSLRDLLSPRNPPPYNPFRRNSPPYYPFRTTRNRHQFGRQKRSTSESSSDYPLHSTELDSMSNTYPFQHAESDALDTIPNNHPLQNTESDALDTILNNHPLQNAESDDLDSTSNKNPLQNAKSEDLDSTPNNRPPQNAESDDLDLIPNNHPLQNAESDDLDSTSNNNPLQNAESDTLDSTTPSNHPLQNAESDDLDSTPNNNSLEHTESNDLDSILNNYPLQNTGLHSILNINGLQNNELDSIPDHPLWYTELLHTDEPRSFRVDPYWFYLEEAKARVRHDRSLRDSLPRRNPPPYNPFRRRNPSPTFPTRRNRPRHFGRGKRSADQSSSDDGFNHSFTNNVPGSNIFDPSKSNPQVGFGSGRVWYSSRPNPSFRF